MQDRNEAIDCYERALKYAKTQNLFELVLKSAVRLYEFEGTTAAESSTTLLDLYRYFTQHNGQPAWDQLVSSKVMDMVVDDATARAPSMAGL